MAYGRSWKFGREETQRLTQHSFPRSIGGFSMSWSLNRCLSIEPELRFLSFTYSLREKPNTINLNISTDSRPFWFGAERLVGFVENSRIVARSWPS
jgi:hypothetical protein